MGIYIAGIFPSILYTTKPRILSVRYLILNRMKKKYTDPKNWLSWPEIIANGEGGGVGIYIAGIFPSIFYTVNPRILRVRYLIFNLVK